MTEIPNLFADDLERVLEGERDLGQILESGRAEWYGEAFVHCFAPLHRFWAEEEVRARDPAYKAMQEAEMRRLIQLLREEASAERLRAIDFLGRSPPNVRTSRRGRWLPSLLLFNAAVFFATVAFLPRLSSFSWNPRIPFSYFINLRHRWDIAWTVLFASVLASAGVYLLVGGDGERRKDS